MAAQADGSLWFKTLTVAGHWKRIGLLCEITTMAALGTDLFAVTVDSQLRWSAVPDFTADNPTMQWKTIGSAPSRTRALAAFQGKLYASTLDNALLWRDTIPG